MSEQKLSIQDIWLVKNWERARQFEEAMASAREHYEQLFYKVRDKVQQTHKEISVCRPHQLSEQVPEADWKYSGGCAGFCKSKWRGDWAKWPPRIWFWNISLDELVTERADAPTASVYLGFGKYNRRKLEDLRERLRKRIQGDSRWRALNFNTDCESQSESWFYYYLPQERTELLDMVVRDGGRLFVNCIAKHVQLIADLLTGLDDFLRKPR